MSSQRVVMEEILCHFSKLEDPRSTVNRKHPLSSVIVIAVLAVLAGAAGPTAIALWAETNAEFLLGVLSLPNGIPRKDVYRRLLCVLKPAAFQECFITWIESLRQVADATCPVDRPILAIDGKTVRRSHDRAKGLGPLHSVSVWASDYGLTLAQVSTDEKSSENAAIPAAVDLVDLKRAIVTIDAAGTQKAIADKIVEEGGDYLLAVKDNQPNLKRAIIDFVTDQFDNEGGEPTVRQVTRKTQGHGRKETREVFQFAVPESFRGRAGWRGLATVGFVKLTAEREGKTTEQIRYYVSSLPLGVKQFAHAIRSHWGIENSCHWSLDVTYREDESRTRDINARLNVAWLYRFTLSLLKQHPSKQSLAMKRQKCGWSTAFLTEVIAASGT